MTIYQVHATIDSLKLERLELQLRKEHVEASINRKKDEQIQKVLDKVQVAEINALYNLQHQYSTRILSIDQNLFKLNLQLRKLTVLS